MNFKISLESTCKAMADREKKRGRRKYIYIVSIVFEGLSFGKK